LKIFNKLKWSIDHKIVPTINPIINPSFKVFKIIIVIAKEIINGINSFINLLFDKIIIKKGQIMKKILFLVLISSFLFSSNLNTIEKKLDLILNKLNKIEKQLNIKDYEIKKLKKQLKIQEAEIKKQQIQTKKEFAIKSCDRVKVVSLKYEYYDEIVPYYKLRVVLKNKYPKDIKFIKGSLFAEDKDRVKILEDYINREVNFKANSTISIKQKHIINNDLEKYLKDENPQNLHIYFSPTRIEFKDGTVLECN